MKETYKKTRDYYVGHVITIRKREETRSKLTKMKNKPSKQQEHNRERGRIQEKHKFCS